MRTIMGVICSVSMVAALIACGDIKNDNSGKTAASGYSVTAASISGGSADAGWDILEKKQIKYEFNDYEPVCYKDVVWTAMSEKMSKEDYKDFCEYLPVLTGEAAVHWQTGEDEDDEKDEEENSDVVLSLRFQDMTGDGVKELMLQTSGAYPHVIIHKEGNEFYGAAYVRRWLLSPQKSGYFWIGKGNGSWNVLSFRDKKFEITSVTWTEQKWEENGTLSEESYYIQDKKVSKKKYKEWEKKHLTGEIREYELPVKVEEKHK